MANIPKPGELIAAIEAALKNALGKDISTVEGFSRDQLLRIEKLSIRLSEMILAGEFKDDPEGQDVYLGILKDLITNFKNTLKGLGAVALEKAWNAVVDVVWKALDKATGLTLPRPIP